MYFRGVLFQYFIYQMYFNNFVLTSIDVACTILWKISPNIIYIIKAQVTHCLPASLTKKNNNSYGKLLLAEFSI